MEEKRKKILVVDDDATVQTRLGTALGNEGYMVDRAGSLNEAIEQLKCSPAAYSFVIVDLAIKLKKRDERSIEYLGLQLMDFIREQWQITKIIAISFVPAGAARKLTPGVLQRYDYYIQKNGDYFDEIISAVRYLAKSIRIKPRVFIGSTLEKLDIAHVIEENLTHTAECTVWDQDVFRLSKYNLESLIQVLGRSRYAIFAFTPDDMVKIRGNEYPAARDNVIFETGLAIGMLGRERVFLVSPSEPREMWIPSDLFGITIGSYQAGRSDGNWVAALGPFCSKVKRLMEFPE